MAFDRNHLTIPNLHIIEPAVRYYERHGSKDTKMKMYFYLGVAQYDTGDLESAIVSYIRAKEYSLYSDNLMFKGLISFVISDVFLAIRIILKVFLIVRRLVTILLRQKIL